MTYRELVERQLAVRHADLELGLSRAREQEPFVIHVSDLLDKAGIEYAVRMDKDFQTTPRPLQNSFPSRQPKPKHRFSAFSPQIPPNSTQIPP
ncbi:hypothetical protein ACVWQR_01630 [Neisseria meningitidis]